jgi:hypothetical protein
MIIVTVRMGVMSLEQVLVYKACFTARIEVMNQKLFAPCMLMMEYVIAVMGQMSLEGLAKMFVLKMERRL